MAFTQPYCKSASEVTTEIGARYSQSPTTPIPRAQGTRLFIITDLPVTRFRKTLSRENP